jgi:hypothetical protein
LSGDETREASAKDEDAVWGGHEEEFSFDAGWDLDDLQGPLLP